MLVVCRSLSQVLRTRMKIPYAVRLTLLAVCLTPFYVFSQYVTFATNARFLVLMLRAL